MNYENIYGLAFECPYFDRQDDCPLKEKNMKSGNIKVKSSFTVDSGAFISVF
jgi:hypothetical protein